MQAEYLEKFSDGHNQNILVTLDGCNKMLYLEISNFIITSKKIVKDTDILEISA